MKPSMRTTIPARSVLVAVLAVAATALGACGSSATPAASPSSAVASSAPAPSAPAPSAPASSAPSASASSSSTPSASASSGQQADEVEDVTTDFVQAALTLGYPDKTIGDYLDRIEPLMSKDGFATLKKALGDTATADKQAAQLHDQRIRGVVQITSPAKVTSIDGDKATASVSFRQKRQQQRSGAWKTVETKAEDTSKVSLVQDGGKWLVDTVE